LGLIFFNPHGALIPLEFELTEQIQIIDLLDQVAGWCGYLFVIQGAALTLVDKTQANGEVAALPASMIVSLDYQPDLAVAAWVAGWNERYSGTGQLLERKRSVRVEGTQGQGETRDVKPYNRDHSAVRARLGAQRDHRAKLPARLASPLSRLANLGERFTIVDDSLAAPMSVQGQVESFELDFQNDLITIEARVEVL